MLINGISELLYYVLLKIVQYTLITFKIKYVVQQLVRCSQSLSQVASQPGFCVFFANNDTNILFLGICATIGGHDNSVRTRYLSTQARLCSCKAPEAGKAAYGRWGYWPYNVKTFKRSFRDKTPTHVCQQLENNEPEHCRET